MAPQVKMAAAERIASFVDPALSELIRIVQLGDSDAVKLAAVKDVLDRAGYKPTDKQQISGPDGSAFTFTIQAPNREASQLALEKGQQNGYVPLNGASS